MRVYGMDNSLVFLTKRRKEVNTDHLRDLLSSLPINNPIVIKYETISKYIYVSRQVNATTWMFYFPLFRFRRKPVQLWRRKRKSWKLCGNVLRDTYICVRHTRWWVYKKFDHLLYKVIYNSNIASFFGFVDKRAIYRWYNLIRTCAGECDWLFHCQHKLCDIFRKCKYKLPSPNQSIPPYL